MSSNLELKSKGIYVRGTQIADFIGICKSSFYNLVQRGRWPGPQFCMVSGTHGFRWTREVVIGMAEGKIKKVNGIWQWEDGTPVHIDEDYIAMQEARAAAAQAAAAA